MRLNSAPFEAMKAGKKTVEIRLNDEKRKGVKKGDVIIFTRTDGAEQLTVEVVGLYPFGTFRELYEKFTPEVCGSAHKGIGERLADTYKNYYSKEQEKRCGVLGIEIKLAGQEKGGL
jgi:ASC-1-like (ASCH) protein